VARAWAGQRAGRDERDEDLRAFGVADEEIERWRGKTGDEDDCIGVLPWCLPSVEVFLALSTQWRRAGLAGVAVGLDYAALPPTLWMMGRRPGHQDRATLFEDLRTMEGAALEVMAARDAR